MSKLQEDLLKRINGDGRKLSKGQKLIATYIKENIDLVADMTAARLGEEVGVSESTVVRFAMEIGYDGYPAMQRDLQEIIKSKLTFIQRMKVGNARIDHSDSLKSVMQSDIDRIKTTLENIDRDTFDNTVNAIVQAKKIYIIGLRSSAALASFMGFYFTLLFDNVQLVMTTSVSEIFEQILNVNKGDVVIGISFPRYSSRTIKAMEYAKSRGAKLVAITDNRESTLAQIADYALLAKSDMLTFADSLVAPMSVINALITAIGGQKNDEVVENFERLEQIWDEYEIYEKDE